MAFYFSIDLIQATRNKTTPFAQPNIYLPYKGQKVQEKDIVSTLVSQRRKTLNLKNCHEL